VAILVAPDVDALCAVRILCAMLRSDGVNYSLTPVSGTHPFDLTIGHLLSEMVAPMSWPFLGLSDGHIRSPLKSR
jgi:hypothetical protein